MQRLLAICLSVLMLLSSTGITYAEHFCGSFKMMSKLTLGEESLHCGMAVVEEGCDSDQVKAMDCCDNHYLAVQTDDTFAKVQFNLALSAAILVAQPSNFSLSNTPKSFTAPVAYRQYRPPPNIWNFQVAFQTFLI